MAHASWMTSIKKTPQRTEAAWLCNTLLTNESKVLLVEYSYLRLVAHNNVLRVLLA